MKHDEYGNDIYELTKEEKELVSEHNLFYDDLIKYGSYVLNNSFNNPMEDYELTIYSNIYRILELLDTLRVMTENSLINSAFIVFRSLMESSIQLCYIISDDNQIKKRATVLQMLDIKRTAIDEDKYFESMEKNECYKSYIDVINNKRYSNWYSYCEGKKTTLEDLCELIDLKEIYSGLYRPLCIDTHEVNHMETNIVFGDDGRFKFKPFRMFENHVLLLNCVLKVMKYMLNRLINKYGNDEIKEDWNAYEKKLDRYIGSNDSLSKFEKQFNPSMKWF